MTIRRSQGRPGSFHALIILILAIILSACSPDTADGTIDVALAQEPPTLDIQVNSSISGRMIALGNVYEKPVVLDGEGRIRCELASSFELSEDGRHLAFLMRDDVLFHDGSRMDGSDAAASLNRWMDRYATASDSAMGNRFRSEGNKVWMDSERPLMMLLMMIASAPQSAVIMPERLAVSSDYLLHEHIGTGPYLIEEWLPGEAVELRRFDGYSPYAAESSGVWGDKSNGPESIRYLFVPDGTTRRLGLESGLYDAIDCVLSDDIPRLSSDPSITLLGGEENGSIAIVFNKREGVFTSLGMRKAAASAMDREMLMKACYGDYGYSLHSDYMEDGSIWSVDSSLDPYGSFSLDDADDLLEDEGYDGSTVRILSSNTSNIDKIAVALSYCLTEAGIRNEVTVVDWASFIEMRSDTSSWDIFISAYSRTSLPQLKSYLSSTNPGWLNDEKALGMLADIDEAVTLEEASSLWTEAQLYLWSIIPVIVPGHYSTVYAVSSDLDGVILGEGFYFWASSFSR